MSEVIKHTYVNFIISVILLCFSLFWNCWSEIISNGIPSITKPIYIQA